MLLDPQMAHAFKLADGTAAAQQQMSSHLGKSRGRLDSPQSTSVTAETESKIPLHSCHLQTAATFLLITGKEKCTLHPTKLGKGSNPEALLKDDQTILFVRSTKGTKAYKLNQDYLQSMWGGFALGAINIKNLSYFGIRRTIKLSLPQKNGRADGQKQAMTIPRGAKQPGGARGAHCRARMHIHPQPGLSNPRTSPTGTSGK